MRLVGNYLLLINYITYYHFNNKYRKNKEIFIIEWKFFILNDYCAFFQTKLESVLEITY